MIFVILFLLLDILEFSCGGNVPKYWRTYHSRPSLRHFSLPLEEQFGWPSEPFWRQDGKKPDTSVQKHTINVTAKVIV
jgi:hypothetical protein